jgi:hypothetical protein
METCAQAHEKMEGCAKLEKLRALTVEDRRQASGF